MLDKNDDPSTISKEIDQNPSDSDIEAPHVVENLHGLKRQLKNRHAQMITIGQSFTSSAPLARMLISG